MPDRGTVTYLFDGSFDGLMTAVFEAYARHPRPRTVADAADYQMTLDGTAVTVETDAHKAARVVSGIRTKLGTLVYTKVWLVFLSGQPERGGWIYDYLRLGFDEGAAAYRRLADKRVFTVDKWSRLVDRERGNLLQFVRFSKRRGGVYYGAIEPTYDVLTLLMPYFFDRFRTQAFVLHDRGRNLYGVSDARQWVIVTADELTLPEAAEEEYDYQRLWRAFYDAVAITERLNPALRRQHMPKKYWRDITEMQLPSQPPLLLSSGEPDGAPDAAGVLLSPQGDIA